MGQKVKHSKLIKRGGASFSGDVFSGLSNEEANAALSHSQTYATLLTQPEQSAYLRTILTSNLPYYKALAKHRNRSFPIPRSRHDAKNHHLLSRLTESGLSVMQMQFAKKPKNPV